MPKQITKISFTDAGKKGVSIGYKNYSDQNEFIGTTNKDYKPSPSKEFEAALNEFLWHLMFLCEFQDAEKYTVIPSDQPKGFRVCGVTVTGADEKEGLMITGYKTLSNGKGFAFNSPNIKWSEEGYPHMEKMQTCWSKVKEEAGAYLAGKYVMSTPELPFNSGEPAPGSN